MMGRPYQESLKTDVQQCEARQHEEQMHVDDEEKITSMWVLRERSPKIDR